LWVGLLTLPLVWFTGVAIPRPREYVINSGCHPDRFWTQKAHWRHQQFDVVVTGDSRIYRCVSSDAMQEALPGYRIGNFGFDSVGYDQTYLVDAEQLVNSRSSKRTIVLGVSPWSLTRRASADNGFLQEKRRPAAEVAERLYLKPMLSFFRPVSVPEFLAAARKEQDSVSQPLYHQNHHADGWVASRLYPEAPESALALYQVNFANNPVDHGIENALFQTIRQWTQKGIRVFAFRPPATAAMVELENSSGGFDEKEFVLHLAEAGGQWLDFDVAAYHSYDGSHLDEDSARHFSRDLAASISEHLKNPER